MLRKIFFTTALLTALNAFALPITTARGEVDVAEVPKTVAVYDIGVLDTLDALGVKAAGVTDKIKPEFLAENQKGKVIGTFFEPNLEALAELNPDLIIIAARSAKQYDSVSRIAPTIDLTLDGKQAYDETLQRTMDLGKIFHKDKEAQAVVDKLNALKEETKAAAKNRGKVLAILVNGPKLSLYGPDSRVGFLQSTLGLNLLNKEKEDVSAHGNPISFEYIAQENPDWIFVIDRGAAVGGDLAPAKTVLDTPLVQNTTAGKQGQIVYLSPAEVYIDIGGPQALEKTLTEIRDALTAHPVK